MARLPGRRIMKARILVLAAVVSLLSSGPVGADGKVVRPREYEGSLEERAQEAIIIFQGSDEPGKAVEHLILKIGVRGKAEHFAWVIPFPNEPKVAKEAHSLFVELHFYVETRLWKRHLSERTGSKEKDKEKGDGPRPVKVLSRQVVGSYDIA